MKGIITDLKKLYDANESRFVNIFFWVFIISFFVDRVLFYFLINFPFFIITAIIIFPFLFFTTQNKNTDKRQIYLLIFSFTIVTILNSIIYVFGVKNISDLLFIVLFVTIYYYYRDNINNLKVSNIYVLLFMSIFLFSFTFFNIDSDSSSKSKTKYSSIYSKEIPSFTKPPITKDADVKIKPKKVDKFKQFKVRHTGLFRRTHIASYFFGFLFLFFSYQYQKKKGLLNIFLLITCLLFCFYTGIRVIPVALTISIFIYLFRRKYIIYLAMLMVTILLLIIANDHFLQLTKNTIFYQYFYLIHSFTENITSMPRFRLYDSWWTEVKTFKIWDFIIGKAYLNTMIVNSKNTGLKVWFHNDFLNIFFTYGIWCTILYIWFFIKIYRDNKVVIRQNIFIFVFYCSMILAAIFNGFYYYFPIFLLYIFFLMIKNEKQIAR